MRFPEWPPRIGWPPKLSADRLKRVKLHPIGRNFPNCVANSQVSSSYATCMLANSAGMLLLVLSCSCMGCKEWAHAPLHCAD